MTGPHETRRMGHLRPEGRENPRPSGVYDLVVVGGGPAGLVCAAGSAGLGLSVALVEKHLLGGDCLNTGCVPSKALLRSAHAAAAARRADALGVRTGEVTVDFAAVMERMRRLRADISEHDGVARFTEKGCDVYLGEGRFTGPDVFAIDGRELRFRRAVIATGARPALPPIPGLAGVDALTSDTLFGLTELPERLIVIGGGAIGSEMSQAFARFGTQVTLLEMAPHLLPHDDPEAGALVAAALAADGADVRVATGAKSVRRDGSEIVVELPDGEVRSDVLLVAAGRRANVEGLGLDAAGVLVADNGLVGVDTRLRTSNPRIYAAGDVCSRIAFTHAADEMARTVIRNAFFPGSKRADRLVIPWCTYTDPEVAHVGVTARDAAGRDDIDVVTVPLGDMDRGITDGLSAGFLRVRLAASGDAILGATIVGPHAGDLIQQIAVAMAAGMGLGALGAVVRPYPTLGEAVRRAADERNRGKLTESTQRWLARWFGVWRRFA